MTTPEIPSNGQVPTLADMAAMGDKDIANLHPTLSVKPGSTTIAPPEARPSLLLPLQTLGDLGWLDRDPPARDALVSYVDAEGDQSIWLPGGIVGMLIAEGGAGKSQAALHLAVGISTGTQCFGAKSPLHVMSERAVLVLAGEEPPDELHRRFFWMVRNESTADAELIKVAANIVPKGLLGESTALLSRKDSWSEPQETRFLLELRDLLNNPSPSGLPWGLVIVDPAVKFAPPEVEKDATIGERFTGALASLTQTRDRPTVLLVHHTNKVSRQPGAMDNESASRGGTWLTDAARWVGKLTVTKKSTKTSDDDETAGADLTLSVPKTNYTAPREQIRLARLTGGVLRALAAAENSPARRDEEARAAQRAIALKAKVWDCLRRRETPISVRNLEVMLRGQGIKFKAGTVVQALGALAAEQRAESESKGWRPTTRDETAD